MIEVALKRALAPMNGALVILVEYWCKCSIQEKPAFTLAKQYHKT